ncbi:enoyl-CoA hydratase/isomerase family protein [bacterium]|nr:enoyl-CoA hydratase/isomerase family protein [bacterium]
MNFKDIELKIYRKVGKIIFNRPKALNAYNENMAMELVKAIDYMTNSQEVCVIVISGSGRAFMAGADIMMLDSWMNDEDGKNKVKNSMDQLFYPNLLEQCPKPVIAAVNGLAYGEGCEIALACDIRIGAESAKFAQPEINLGIIPGAGGTQRLNRIIGRSKSMEMLFTGDSIDSQEAYRLGLISRVTPDLQLVEVVDALCEKICSKSPEALRQCKKAVVEGYNLGFYESIANEKKIFIDTLFSENAKKGVVTFLEKSKSISS